MYDTIFVAKALIDQALADEEINIETFEGYYDFQTKDLDSFLSSFYIEEDGSFLYKEQKYKHVSPDPSSDKKWNFGHLVPDGPSKMIEDTRTSYIEFYDLCSTETERIFVTFTAHVKGGRLAEPIILKSVERTNLAEEREKHKIIQRQRDRVMSTWQWKLASFISSARWKTQRFFNPLMRRLDKLEINLRAQAELYKGE